MQFNALGSTSLKVSNVSLGGAAFTNFYGPKNSTRNRHVFRLFTRHPQDNVDLLFNVALENTTPKNWSISGGVLWTNQRESQFEEDRSLQLIRETLKCGVNYMETAPWYGQGSSERTFGKALKGVPRNSYFIGSKVGRYELATEKMFDFSAEKTAAAVDNTLRLLGLDYVDLIQIHDCTFALDSSIILKETLPALEQAVRDGKARYIGLADYNLDLMVDLIEQSNVKISTILSYSKGTLADNRLQNYTSFFKSKGVGVINAGATGMGLLSNQGPQPWHPASDEIKAICKRASEYCKGQNVELARLASWFSLNQPGVDTNICGFYNVDQMRDTLNVLENGLSDHEKKVLAEIQMRYFDGKVPLHWDNVELPAYREKLKKKGLLN